MNEQGPPGAPPKKVLPDAYRELMENLYYAQHQFHSKGDAGREGVRIACQSVVRFLAVSHENPELAAPFLAMRAALIDLEQGIRSELLVEDAADIRRSRSAFKKHFQTLASACLEVLVQNGEGLEQAASMVARYVDKWPGKGNQLISGTTIRNWRDQQRAGSAGERKSFENIYKHMLTCPNPRKEVEKLLRGGPPGVPKS